MLGVDVETDSGKNVLLWLVVAEYDVSCGGGVRLAHWVEEPGSFAPGDGAVIVIQIVVGHGVLLINLN